MREDFRVDERPIWWGAHSIRAEYTLRVVLFKRFGVGALQMKGSIHGHTRITRGSWIGKAANNTFLK